MRRILCATRTSKEKEEKMVARLARPFDLGLVESIRVNKSALERRVATLGTRHSFKQESQVAAYIKAVSFLDLTTLSGDDTFGRVERLCAKALRPVESETLKLLKLEDLRLTTGAVCVYPVFVEAAKEKVLGRIPVACVATGFPAGQTFLPVKLHEIRLVVEAGADEVDVVISRHLALDGKWEELYKEILAFRETCGPNVMMKTILGVGDLKESETIAKASAIAIMAGSDFIKTSTGFEPTNATLEAGLIMVRQIRRFHELYGERVGFKPAGGISTAKDSLAWLTLILDELGPDWLDPRYFRIGASRLLTDLERQLHHLATGRYSASHRHPMP